MKIFISGATGFIGSRLALRLAGDGHQIHALYRDERKIASIQHPNIKLFKGDILDYQSLLIATEGCTQIYHAAAFARVWDREISRIYRLNIEGTLNVVRAGIQSGVKRFVCTSTAGVLGPSLPGQIVDENSPQPFWYFIDYERSKKMMEEALKTISATGIEIVMVNPSRVFGPGVLSESNGITRIMQHYLRGKWRIIPGDGESIGNYVFVDDVVDGHILAMQSGRSGERYILGGSNLSYNEFFEKLAEITGERYFMIHIPISLCLFISGIMLFMARIAGGKPLITPELIRKYNHHWKISSAKAEKELNFRPVSFETGAGITVHWLKNLKMI